MITRTTTHKEKIVNFLTLSLNISVGILLIFAELITYLWRDGSGKSRISGLQNRVLFCVWLLC